jgi:hypothetical protein
MGENGTIERFIWKSLRNGLFGIGYPEVVD